MIDQNIKHNWIEKFYHKLIKNLLTFTFMIRFILLYEPFWR